MIVKKSSPEIIGLKNSIKYQSGSVVSKALINKKTGTVTVFAFGKGQGLSEHAAPFDAFVQILDGKAEIVIAGESFRLKSGEAIILPARKPHALKAVTQFKMILTMIKS